MFRSLVELNPETCANLAQIASPIVPMALNAAAPIIAQGASLVDEAKLRDITAATVRAAKEHGLSLDFFKTL